MDPATALTSQVRDHYVAQFEAFVAEQERLHPGGAEIKAQLPGGTFLRHRICIDYVVKATEQGVEFQPDKYLRFEPFSGSYGNARLTIEQLRWGDVLIDHDLPAPPERTLDNWFERWFDPDDARFDPDAAVGHIIHSVLIEPGLVSVDFGTAPVEAFWQLLDLLEEAGARKIRVHCTEGQT